MTKHSIPTVLLPEVQVAERCRVSPRTLRRWDEDLSLAFPPATIIRRRRYRSLQAIEAWEAIRRGRPA